MRGNGSLPDDIVRLWQAAEQRGDLNLVLCDQDRRLQRRASRRALRVEGDRHSRRPRHQHRVHADVRQDGSWRQVRTDPSADLRADRYRWSKALEDMVATCLTSMQTTNMVSGLAHRQAIWHLEDQIGFDGRFVFHSIRKTVANMFENAECPEGVAADVVGHLKPTMTYGLYSGITRMDLRAKWLAKAIRYPASDSVTASNGD